MPVAPRVFVSVPSDEWLTPELRAIRDGLAARIDASGFDLDRFYVSGLSSDLGWSFDNVQTVMRRCQGAVILGFPRWRAVDGAYDVLLPTAYNHYEGALAISQQIPTLLIADHNIANQGVFWQGGGRKITYYPPGAGAEWLDSPAFVDAFKVWSDQIKARPHAFLGYCSKAETTANKILLYLKDLGYSVMNWASDFDTGRNLLQEIDRAASTCQTGIFLLTKDDDLAHAEVHAAPRDNVIFEAGYFIRAKGKERVLIIREKGAKMPVDLGGDLYLNLPNRKSTATIEHQLRQFLEKNL